MTPCPLTRYQFPLRMPISWWAEEDQHGKHVIFASCRRRGDSDFVTRMEVPSGASKALAWLMVEAMTTEILFVCGSEHEAQPVGLLGGAPC